MTFLLMIIHVFVSLFLIFVVLIQGGKGAEMGAAFGGSSQTLFGARGAATALGKATTVIASVFMITSLVLAIASVKGTPSVMKTTLPTEQRPTTPMQGQGGSPMAPAQQNQPVGAAPATVPAPATAPAQPAPAAGK